MSPTRALASLGVSLDDEQIVQLLELIAAMDEHPIRVTAHDVMTTNVITIGPEASTTEAARLLSDNHISGAPVLGRDGSLVGILSVFDLLAKSAATVGDIMNRDVATVQETAPISSVRAVLVTQRLPTIVGASSSRASATRLASRLSSTILVDGHRERDRRTVDLTSRLGISASSTTTSGRSAWARCTASA
jgi:signal-transduction protein with cAMP-binding, CBS, and nucleotidyltransferase domain